MDQHLETSSLAIVPLRESINNLPKISLIGSSICIDSIRVALASLHIESIQDNFQDLGNLRPESRHSWNAYLCELVESEACIPLYISDNRYIDNSIQSFQSLVDYKCAIISHTILDIGRPVQTAQYDCYVGVQSHYMGALEIAEEHIVRLTDLRYNHHQAEVTLRNADIAYIDLSAIRHSDNIGHRSSGPAGMTIEEACQVAKYIGASLNLKGVIIGSYDENNDVHGITAQNIALLCFYLTVGYQLRISESHQTVADMSDYNTYTVVPYELDYELIFVENKISGRWWLKLKDVDGRENLVPCSKEDYQQACNNIITDKVTQVFSLV